MSQKHSQHFYVHTSMMVIERKLHARLHLLCCIIHIPFHTVQTQVHLSCSHHPALRIWRTLCEHDKWLK